jgi:hypothetical protein
VLLIQDLAIYLQKNGRAINIPANALPAYPGGLARNAAAGIREAARAENLVEQNAWETYIIVCTVTRAMIAEAIDYVYYAALVNPTEGLNGVSIQQLIVHISTNYAQISQPEINANMENFQQGINSMLPLAVYTCKQEQCQMFAHDAGVLISKATMVTTGTKAVIQCGGMMQAWREWQRRPAVQHTWLNWVAHWTAAFTEAQDISRLTTGEGVFGPNSVLNNTINNQVATSLDNLANAVVAHNTTVESLIATNQQQVQTIANLTAAIASLGGRPAPPAPSAPPLQAPGALQPAPAPQPAQGGWTQVGPKPPWDQNGYYWTHRHKVKEGHNSGNCSYPRNGHQRAATRASTMNGSTRNCGWPPLAQPPAPSPAPA